ncbi:MAG: ComF family protein [Alistipes sp.]|nr:ComF family protein [Alistipes sp.]
MSMLRRVVADVVSLLYPRECAVCGDALVEGEEFVCTTCRFRIPLTGFALQSDNPMKERLSALVPIREASAHFFFVADSHWQRAIHDFKYYGRWLHARNLGVWYGHLLRQSGNYDDIDIVVPVPLHNRKLLKRGYNQSDYIADGIASVLGVKVVRHALVRIVNNESQTHQSRHERWDNVEGNFAVRHPESLSGKHILLVDDVLTTGATIIACCEAMLAACDDIEISVATLSVSQREFSFDR